MRAQETTERERTEDELFAEVARARSEGRRPDRPLGLLVERWRRPALYVIGRIQASYGRRSDDDAEEIFQDAVAKLVERGLDQFRGISEQMPGKAASPRTFFLRIAKHVAIDRYRRAREVLADEGPGGGEPSEAERVEAQRAVEAARQTESSAEVGELYWQAYRRLQAEHPNEAGAWALYHHEDVEDHGEVARRMGISIANSYKRVSRAQAYLKIYLLELQEESR